MEETDPSHVVREKKHIVGTDAPGSMPMVPPMGMPMSPHLAGQPTQPVQPYDGESPHVLADAEFLPVQSFGGEPVLSHGFVGVESSALTPMEPAAFTPMEPAMFTPVSPAIPAMPVTPAMQGIPALPATQATPLEPRILPAAAEPVERLAGGDHDGCCCCCGDFHDGQEDRPFNRDVPAGDTTPAESQQLTHDNLPAGQQTPQGEVTKPVPTDEAPDSDACCACCGDKHAGLEDSTNDSLTTPGSVTEPGEEDESGEGKDDDCSNDDDEKPGKEDGSGDGKADDDDCPRDDDDEKPGKEDDSEQAGGEGKEDDDCPHDDDNTSPDEPGELPATLPATNGDVPLSPRTLPAQENLPASQTTPLSPVESTPRTAVPTPQNAAAQPESAYRLEPMQRDQGELLAPKSATPMQPPLQAGVLNQKPLAPKNDQQIPQSSSEKPFYKSVPPTSATPMQTNALTPAVSVPPAEGENLPGRTQHIPEKEAPVTEGAYKTEPGPGATKEQPVKPVTNGTPAYNSGTPYSSGSPFPGSTGQGTGVPQDGNVGPDPNIKFDEASFNQLSAVIGGMKSTLDDSYKIDVVYLDEELLLQPDGQKWAPAQKLVKRGGIFGGSVKRESDALEKTLSTFHQALEQAKAVFKETNDLAAYDATKFTTEYPGFTSGPGVV